MVKINFAVRGKILNDLRCGQSVNKIEVSMVTRLVTLRR